MNRENKSADHTGRSVYLIDGSRTPFLRTTGKPGPFSASDLALQCGRPLLARQPFVPEQLDEVILGCVAPAADEANIARITALRLGCGHKVPAWTVQRNCASGMQAIDSAARQIRCGQSHLVLAGGAESMSHYPVMLNPAMVGWLSRWRRAPGPLARARLLGQLRPAYFQVVIALLKGLTDPVVGLTMGQTAEQLAWRFDISREAMDRYAVESHQRLQMATDAGLEEIEPMIDADGNLYDYDEGLRPDSSVEALAKLSPVFDRPVGRVTAGNSAQITDGAAWVLLASEEAVEQHALKPLCRLIDSQWSALDPAQMGLGPTYAMAELLKRHRLESEDIGYWEINEAFAAQVLACLAAWRDNTFCREELGLEAPFAPIPLERLNADGGGISLGHPVGASGARLVLHLALRLRQEQQRYGMASLCIGGGQGGAMLLESTPEAIS